MSNPVEQVTTHTATVSWRAGSRDLRAHEIQLGQETVAASCQPAFGGDPTKADPEQLLVAALSSCHMLWFLDFARRERLRVFSYRDEAEGTLAGDRFSRVVLRPRVEVEGDVDPATVEQLHHRAHEACFIANSVRFPVDVELE